MIYKTKDGMTIRQMMTSEVGKYCNLTPFNAETKKAIKSHLMDAIQKNSLKTGLNFSVYYKGEMKGRLELKADGDNSAKLNLAVIKRQNWNDELSVLARDIFFMLEEEHQFVEILKVAYDDEETGLRLWYEYILTKGKLFLSRGPVETTNGKIRLVTARDKDIERYSAYLEDNQQEAAERKQKLRKLDTYAIYHKDKILGVVQLKTCMDGVSKEAVNLEIVQGWENHAEQVIDTLIMLCREHRICKVLKVLCRHEGEKARFWKPYDVENYVIPEERHTKTA